MADLVGRVKRIRSLPGNLRTSRRIDSSTGVVVVIVCALRGGLSLAVAVPPQAPEIDWADPYRVETGKSVFEQACATCHGGEGAGASAPILRGRSWEPSRLWAIIHDGAGLAFMPKFSDELSDEEIGSVIAYVMSISANPPIPAAEPVDSGSAAELPAALVGEPERGREIFLRSEADDGCQDCHRLEGEGSSDGHDLSRVTSRSPRVLFRDVLLAHPDLAEVHTMRDLLDLLSFLKSAGTAPVKVTLTDVQTPS